MSSNLKICNIFNNLVQSFRSGSGSMWIHIKSVPLDQDPYWEYGYGSVSRTVKMVSKKGKTL